MRNVIVLFLFLFSTYAYSQVSTKDDYYGTWSNSSSWVSNVTPNPLTNAINDGIDIYGYITREGDLSFANVNAANDFTINDTLVIEGSLTLANKAANLVIPSGGLLIVLGDFTADNKITVSGRERCDLVQVNIVRLHIRADG